MRAIRQHAFGGPQELRLEQMPDPHPADGQVRIRVESAGVHLLDTVIRRGEAVPRAMPKLPMTPGREVAGVIDVIGPAVAEPWLFRYVDADPRLPRPCPTRRARAPGDQVSAGNIS